jgi:uncharacterized damage-inducible protein DinB
MGQLAESLIAESEYAAPAHVIEALPEHLAHQKLAGAAHSIYEELWHLAFWQRITLNWISEVETPYPPHNSDSFPTKEQAAAESWSELSRRFLGGAERAASIARDAALETCPLPFAPRP